jgi:hypothetical protein
MARALALSELRARERARCGGRIGADMNDKQATEILNLCFRPLARASRRQDAYVVATWDGEPAYQQTAKSDYPTEVASMRSSKTPSGLSPASVPSV